MMIDQWNRVQADFRIVQLLDAKEYSQAEQLYATGVASPDWSLDYYFAQHDYERVREEANNSINRWIIQEAGHAQPSSLPGLYAIPERLRFLQALAVYRRTHPEPASTRYPSDGLVAPLLARACTYPPASGPTSRP